jgi:hypothetical protein
MRTNILNQEQKSALALLKGNAEVGKFYLAGGTALASISGIVIRKISIFLKKFFETEVKKIIL